MNYGFWTVIYSKYADGFEDYETKRDGVICWFATFISPERFQNGG